MPISAMHFGKKVVLDEKISAKEALKLVRSPKHVWVDIVRAPHEDVKEILKIVLPEYYKIILENITTDTKPKISVYEDIVYFSIKTFPTKKLGEESQMSVILGDDFLITLREGYTDVGDIRQYFLRSKNKTVDFAVYKLLEIIMVKYYGLLDAIEERIDYYEDQTLQETNSTEMHKGHFKDIMHLKREMLKLHKTLVATRDVMLMLSRGNLEQIKPKTAAYLREIYDDVLQLMDVEETFREVLTTVLEMHMTIVSNQLNTVVKTLTVIATFILVPTLIAGIYGMNFDHMPELAWEYGYEFAIVLMGLSVLAIYLFFRRKKWI